MITVTIRYWAAAKDAAGVAEEQYRLGEPDLDGTDASGPHRPVEVTLADLLTGVRARHAGQEQFLRVLERSSLLVEERAAGNRPPSEVPLTEGTVVEVLPPFAGGCA
ncbi:MoaD/ThiS family protein [Lipingzhangella sp. LS1_29]|uniref:MoaD/ThiS family protein n=1 Tax=Lipingzhangella rawalii TaxID=2055835 RepID=A0ABU2H9A8_9ACTN|nr:MoaD/ThiS family protein [Lipingzhangella rawalii]MDS1271898.1 MoaD/ThiS family protein [Lipingzhangella rawalii]